MARNVLSRWFGKVLGAKAPRRPIRTRSRLMIEALEARCLPAQLYSLPVHAIFVADNDGSRAVNITPWQVKSWIDKTNEVWFSTGVQLEFNPDDTTAYSTLWSTSINSMYFGSEPSSANAIASLYPGKLVYYFRYGDERDQDGNKIVDKYGLQVATGNGFSATYDNFVAMPGFDATQVFGQRAGGPDMWQQNIWIMAHETGHYFGLDHTFVGNSDNITDTPAKASDYLYAHGNTASALDGDQLSDTPPDAGTAFYLNQKLDPYLDANASYTINNITFTPDRHNAMSYFAFDRMHFSPQQVAVIRQTVAARYGANFSSPGILHVYGDPGPVNDDIQITRAGTDLIVSVNSQSVQLDMSSITGIDVDGRDGTDNLTINLDTDNPAFGFYEVTSNSVQKAGIPKITYQNIEKLKLLTGSSDYISADVGSTRAGTDTTIDGAHQLTVGNLGSTGGIQGTLHVNNSAAYTLLTVDDSADPVKHTVTLDTAGSGILADGVISGLSLAPITYRYNDSSGVTLSTGTAVNNTINVKATNKPVTLIGHANGTVNVGSNGSVANIFGDLTITDPAAYFTINVNDSATSLPHPAVTLDTITLDGFATGRISGLAFGKINYRYLDTAGVNVQTGTGGATVNVKATGFHVPVTLVGHASGLVNVGDAGSVQQIQGALTVSDPPAGAFVTLNVDDSMDSLFRTVTLDSDGASYGRISGLAPAPIKYNYADTIAVTVQTGTGNATVYVKATNSPVNLIGHSDATVNVGSAGSVQPILGNLSIIDPPVGAHATINVNDAADLVPRPNVVLGTVPNTNFGRITGLAPATIFYSYLDTAKLTVQTGIGGATIAVKATGCPTQLVGHAPGTVNVGDAGSLQQLKSSLTVADPPSLATLNIDDSADAIGRTVTMSRTATAGTIAGLAPAAIIFVVADVGAINLNLGTGSDTVLIRALGNPLTINSGSSSGIDTIKLGSVANTLGSITAPVTLNAGPADKLTFNDQGTAADRTYTMGASSVTWSGGPTVSYIGFTTLALNGGSGTDTYVLAGTSSNAVVTVTGGSGNNTVVGSNTSNIWYLPGINSGILFGPAYLTQPSFSNMANLQSSPAGDDYEFGDGGKITGNLIGSGKDLLDYRNYSTSVIVDLQLSAPGTSTGIGGVLSGIYAVFGGTVTPAGPGVYNLLIGNGGSYLVGGAGRRNILVAGGTPSQLLGGDGEDLMIAGTTAYDTESGLTSWKALADYWASADSFDTRAANLLAGAGVPLLDASTVIGNGAGNILKGQGGKVLLYSDGLDAAIDFVFAQHVPINP
jgi:hypothetical protein